MPDVPAGWHLFLFSGPLSEKQWDGACGMSELKSVDS